MLDATQLSFSQMLRTIDVQAEIYDGVEDWALPLENNVAALYSYNLRTGKAIISRNSNNFGECWQLALCGLAMSVILEFHEKIKLAPHKYAEEGQELIGRFFTWQEILASTEAPHLLPAPNLLMML